MFSSLDMSLEHKMVRRTDERVVVQYTTGARAVPAEAEVVRIGNKWQIDRVDECLIESP